MKYLEKIGFKYKLLQKIASKMEDMKDEIKSNIEDYLYDSDTEKTDRIKVSKTDISRTFYTKSKIKEAFKDTLSEDEIEACLENIDPTEYTNVYVTLNDSALELKVSETVHKVKERVEKECT
jgi:uncharacterized protein YjbJ (UPF0337 family)